MVDKNVQRNDSENVAKAYLNYLYSPKAQEIITQFNYRVNDKAVMAQKAAQFPATSLFTLEEVFGDWNNVMKTHFSTDGTLDKLLAQGRR